VGLVVGDVGQVDGDADEVSGLAADLAQNGQQVAERLSELRDDATRTIRMSASTAVCPARYSVFPASVPWEKPRGAGRRPG
jgi:hypothetical protein